MEKIQENLFHHTEKAWGLLQDLFLSLAPFYRQNEEISDFSQHVIINMFTSLYSTSESIFLLVRNGCVWEADVLLRTLFEGTVKFLFIVIQPLSGSNELIDEYFNIMPEIQKIAEHRKAVDALKQIRLFSDSKHPYESSVLSDEMLAKLEEIYPAKYRKAVEQRWGFSNILKLLIEKDKKYESLTGLYYAYNQSSHFVHYDGAYMKMKADNRNYTASEIMEMDFGHGIRILINVLTFGLMRISEYIARFRNNEKNHVAKISLMLDFIKELDYELQTIIEHVDMERTNLTC